MKKRYFGILFAVCMTVLLLTVTAYAAESGTCGASENGENLTWTLTDDGTLTITGTGDMPDPAPWQPLEEAGLVKCIKTTLNGTTTMVLTEDLTITENPADHRRHHHRPERPHPDLRRQRPRQRDPRQHRCDPDPERLQQR